MAPILLVYVIFHPKTTYYGKHNEKLMIVGSLEL